MQADRTRFEGPRHIDHALVGTAAPVKLRVLLRFDKRPVHHYVYGSKERQICNLLEAVAGVQPDGLVRCCGNPSQSISMLGIRLRMVVET